MSVSTDTYDGAATPPAAAPARRGSQYSELLRQVRSAGLLERRPGRYAFRIALNGALVAAGGAGVAALGDSWWQLLLAAYFGLVFTQLGFFGHDAGHRQIFRSGRANDVLGIVHANLLIGLSYGWWTNKHNRHHSHPNDVDEDPDVGSGAIAWTADQAERRGRFGRFVARHQAYLFFPMLLLEAMHLHVASVRALLARSARRRAVEATLLTVHFAAYLGVLVLVMSPLHAVLFVLVQQGVFGLYLGCAFAPNHKGMPMLSAQDELDYLRRQVLTARNVRGGWLVDYVLGGLNYQIEHHLFPSMPSPSLARCQPLVQAFCREHGLPYREVGPFRSYALVLRYLHQVGASVRRRTAPQT
ncbi:MAG: acyl-CoA desaturase [Actinomycetota bacterium]|nr:acyl-CoA desaturase [Actinomycetota bacterium]